MAETQPRPPGRKFDERAMLNAAEAFVAELRMEAVKAGADIKRKTYQSNVREIGTSA